MTRRGTLEIYLDLLGILGREGEMTRTRMMYASNLAWVPFKRCLSKLEELELIKTRLEERGGRTRCFYSLSDKGRRVQDLSRDMRMLMKA